MALPNRAELTAQAEAASAAIADHEARWGTDTTTMPPGQVERRERLTAGFRRAMTALDDFDARAEKIEQGLAAAQDPANIEPAFGPAASATGRNRANPYATGTGDDLRLLDTPTGLLSRAIDAAEYTEGLSTSARAVLVETLESDRHPEASALVLAATDPHYVRAFRKFANDPAYGHLAFSEAEREAWSRARRAMSTTTESTGAALIPFQLDPSIMLTNAGVADPFRALATVQRTLTGQWTGVKSSGITAEWLPEATAAADGSPSFQRFTVPVHKGSVFAVASYELLGDSDIADQLPGLIADARVTLEAEAFVTGSGSDAPRGIITALSGTASTITTTTASKFGLVDVFALVNATSPRARGGRSPAVVAAYPTLNTIRTFGDAGNASLWTSLGDGTPERLLGWRVAEASGITSTVTGHNHLMIAGDFAKYTIVDRIGTVVQPIPAMTSTASGRPTGEFGWHAWWRVGGDVADPSAFKVLRVKA